MKYEDKQVKGIGKETLKALEQIALNTSIALGERGGIEVRSNDTEDFPEVCITSIQEMLEQAYLLGRGESK